MSLDTLIRKVLDSGIELALVEGAVKIIGHRSAVRQWRDQLRAHKDEIYQYLSAAIYPEPQQDLATWHELAEAYHLHHFGCTKCVGAGQGRGLRCGAGTALWTTYQASIIRSLR
jgi:hypothetical protein